MFTKKHILFTLLCMVSVSVLNAQLAIRPGLELPEFKFSAQKTQSRNGQGPELPEYVDNTLSDYFPEIVSQYGGSCAQAAGIHYLFTYEMNRTLDRKVKSSTKANTFSYRWIWNLLNEGKDQGGHSSDGIEITMNAGCVSVADFGDESTSDWKWPSGYNKYYKALHYRTKTMSKIDLTRREGIETMMAYMNDKQDGLKGGGIAGFSLSNDHWGKKDYTGPSNTGYTALMDMIGGTGGAHAMTLVGYDLAVEYDCNGDSIIQDDEKGAFILVNSWGSWWGSEGRAYIPFKFFLDAGKDEESMYKYNAQALCIETEYIEPTMTIKLTLNYTSRNDITTRFGVGDGKQSTGPASGAVVDTPILKCNGGDHNMQGTPLYSGDKIEMGFDLSPIRDKAKQMKAPCWLIIMGKAIVGKSGSGRIIDATVYDHVDGTEYSTTFNENSNKIKPGYQVFKVPTSDAVKRNNVWYEPVKTSASYVFQPKDITEIINWRGYYGIRESDGHYAKMLIRNYDAQNRKLTIEIKHYE